MSVWCNSNIHWKSIIFINISLNSSLNTNLWMIIYRYIKCLYHYIFFSVGQYMQEVGTKLICSKALKTPWNEDNNFTENKWTMSENVAVQFYFIISLLTKNNNKVSSSSPLKNGNSQGGSHIFDIGHLRGSGATTCK